MHTDTWLWLAWALLALFLLLWLVAMGWLLARLLRRSNRELGEIDHEGPGESDDGVESAEKPSESDALLELEGTLLGDMLAVTVTKIDPRSIIVFPERPWVVQVPNIGGFLVQVVRQKDGKLLISEPGSSNWGQEPAVSEVLNSSSAMVVSGVQAHEAGAVLIAVRDALYELAK